MPQISSGIRSILESPFVYKFFQNLVWPKNKRRHLFREIMNPKPGTRILDIGCGTGSIVEDLPESVIYTGFDPCKSYIDQANYLYKSKGKFFCADIQTASQMSLPESDLVIAIGVLHHLSDLNAEELMKLAKIVLTQEGRLVTVDACFHTEQSALARGIIKRDRGRNVRFPREAESIALKVFKSVESRVLYKQLRVSYTLHSMICS